MTTQPSTGSHPGGHVPGLSDVSVTGRAGPYSGVMSRLVGYVPRSLRGFVIQAGGITSLLARIWWSAVRHPTGYWGAVVEDMHSTIKRSWFPIAAAIFGFLAFTSNLTIQFISIVGATQLFGPTLFVHGARSFTIWVVSIVIAGVLGAALTTDIGTRKVREELDAMAVMGIDPIREIAVPRVVSLTLITVLASVPSMLVTLFSMQLSALYLAGMPASVFFSNVFVTLYPIDVVGVVVNTVFVGLLVGAICSYKGFTAAGGAIGLGRAVNQAVVLSFVGVFVLQLAYQALLLGLFPELGEFR